MMVWSEFNCPHKRVQWRNLVKTFMNVRVPLKLGISWLVF